MYQPLRTASFALVKYNEREEKETGTEVASCSRHPHDCCWCGGQRGAKVMLCSSLRISRAATPCHALKVYSYSQAPLCTLPSSVHALHATVSPHLHICSPRPPSTHTHTHAFHAKLTTRRREQGHDRKEAKHSTDLQYFNPPGNCS